MNPHDFFSKLTDGELAEWHMLKNEVIQLKLTLAAAEGTATDLRQQLTAARIEHSRYLEQYRAEVEKLLGERNAAQADGRRDRNRLVVMARCLPGIIAFFLETYSCFTDMALTPDVQAMRREAREVLTILEPFAE
jgi:hypothetical protein